MMAYDYSMILSRKYLYSMIALKLYIKFTYENDFSKYTQKKIKRLCWIVEL